MQGASVLIGVCSVLEKLSLKAGETERDPPPPMCRDAVMDILIGLPSPACRAAEHSLERSAAAAVPRRRLWYSTPVCRRPCVAPPSVIVTGLLPHCVTTPSATVFGLPPPLCRAAEVLLLTVCSSHLVPRRRIIIVTICCRGCAAPPKYYCSWFADATVPHC